MEEEVHKDIGGGRGMEEEVKKERRKWNRRK